MGAKICQDKQQEDRDVDPEVIKRRSELFKKYVTPFYNMIYSLCIKYSFDPQNVEENYNEVLVNFYRRIETYNPERSIRTWLHICTKRHVWALEAHRQRTQIPVNCDNDIETFSGEEVLCDVEDNWTAMGIDNYRELYSDDVLSALDEIPTTNRDVILLQMAGYSVKEIVEIEYKKGTIQSKSMDTIRSRLFVARKLLKKLLTRDGERIFNKANNGRIR